MKVGPRQWVKEKWGRGAADEISVRKGTRKT